MKKKVGNSMGQEEKYMDEYIKEISEKIEDKKEYYAKISDKIWAMKLHMHSSRRQNMQIC